MGIVFCKVHENKIGETKGEWREEVKGEEEDKDEEDQ